MNLTHHLRVAANRGTTSAYIAGLLEKAAERIDELEKEIDRLEDHIQCATYTDRPWT